MSTFTIIPDERAYHVIEADRVRSVARDKVFGTRRRAREWVLARLDAMAQAERLAIRAAMNKGPVFIGTGP